DIHQFTLSDDPYNIYYVKLRPNALEFIKEVSKKYELHIYTMGTRAYAHKIANILDKEYKYFQQRILSRDDSGSFTQKALHRLFPFDVSKVVIIDDREDVWNGSPNLIPVKPYFFFEGIGDINAPEKLAGNENPDLDANQIKQAKLKDDDTELSNNILRILNKVHSQFYNSKSDTVSVMDILTEMKENVLKKCNIAFSSIIPLEIQPERSRVWKLVETFGGNCFKQISKDLTHLVSKNSKTAKVAEARKLGNIHVVDIEWLFSSVYSFRRQDEKLFHHFKPMNIPQNDEIIPLSATEAHSWEDQGENLMSVVSEIDETALAKLQSLSDEESTDQEFSTREIDSFQNDIYEGDHDDSDDPNDQTSDGYEEGGRNHSKRKRDSSFTGTFQDNTIDGWSHPEEEWIDLGESLEEELLRDLEEN
ncbi:HAD-like protein, partial [Rozella allomycis CSF55]